ncbi:MAG: VWA domain-containing protein [Pirellulales bacterium]
MGDFQIGNPTQVQWLWLVAVCLGAIVFAAAAQRRARTRFATSNLIRRVLPPTQRLRRSVGGALVTAAMVLMVLALVDIRWGKVWRDVPQKGIEVVFVLDVSRSMLADDAAPNRLERAKQQIKDTVDEMAGDRVGLVVFAGDVRQQIPLTTHYDDFKQRLDEVGPHNVRRGGSDLASAIDAASHAFLTKSNAHKAMVIFTDGTEQTAEPLAAARKAHEESGVRIFTVGLGDMDKGSRIPVESQNHADYLEHDGQLVWSKLNGEVLKQVATDTDGAYVPAGTKQVNMADVYHKYIAGVEQTEFETAKINQYEARFQWFLLPALMLLLAEIVITTWPARGAVSRAAAFSHQKAPAHPGHKTSSPHQSTAA